MKPSLTKIAIFASGSGSNFQALTDAAKSGELPADIRLLVCDKPGAFVTQRAEKAGIPVLELLPKQFKDKSAYEKEIAKRLEEENVEYIVLAGYMRLIGPVLLDHYAGRIINIHPSLLPAFPGKDAIGQAVSAGVSETGVTVHYVDEGMDTGPMIAQETVKIELEDSMDEVSRKIHAVEHTLYPATLKRLFSNK